MRTVLLKMSGEAIADVEGDNIISVELIDSFSMQVAKALDRCSELRIAVVVGGGNILRGKFLHGVERIKADHMGMLATVINALALQDSFKRVGLNSRVLTGIEIPKVAEPYIHGRAMRHLEKGRIVILAGGTGNPYFTTDTAAALRAAEISADVLLLAKFGTDGIYSKDPRRFADADKFGVIDYDTVMSLNLQVMDSTAVTLCRDNGMPIYVFDMAAEDSVVDALLGETEAGTLVRPAVPPTLH